MKVILLAEIRGLGRKDDVKDVADGYFRNVLLPKKLAMAASVTALTELEKKKALAVSKKEQLIAELKSKVPALQGLILKFPMKTGEKDEVFGSVTKKDIETALSGRGFKNVVVELNHPLKTLGENEIVIDLGEGVKAKLKVLLEKISNEKSAD